MVLEIWKSPDKTNLKKHKHKHMIKFLIIKDKNYWKQLTKPKTYLHRKKIPNPNINKFLILIITVKQKGKIFVALEEKNNLYLGIIFWRKKKTEGKKEKKMLLLICPRNAQCKIRKCFSFELLYSDILFMI